MFWLKIPVSVALKQREMSRADPTCPQRYPVFVATSWFLVSSIQCSSYSQILKNSLEFASLSWNSTTIQWGHKHEMWTQRHIETINAVRISGLQKCRQRFLCCNIIVSFSDLKRLFHLLGCLRICFCGCFIFRTMGCEMHFILNVTKNCLLSTACAPSVRRFSLSLSLSLSLTAQ